MPRPEQIARWRAAGMCTACGKTPARKDRAWCSPCAAKSRRGEDGGVVRGIDLIVCAECGLRGHLASGCDLPGLRVEIREGRAGDDGGAW